MKSFGIRNLEPRLWVIFVIVNVLVISSCPKNVESGLLMSETFQTQTHSKSIELLDLGFQPRKVGFSMRTLIETAKRYINIPYKWGGDDPMAGFDCSGLAQEILATVGQDPPGDQTAQNLYDHFAGISDVWDGNRAFSPDEITGALAFYGESTSKITHVGFCIDSLRMIEAGSGGRNIQTVGDAIKYNAYVRIRPIHRRKDLVAVIRPPYLMLERDY